MKQQKNEDVEDVVRRAVGGLLPTTEAEVRRAEEEGVELEGDLPEGLRAFRPAGERAGAERAPAATSKVVSLDDRRRASRATSYATHAAFGAFCAAAAAAVVLYVQRPGKDGPGAGRDPFVPGGTSTATASAPAPSPAIVRIEAAPACASPVSECPSGRSCIPSSIAEIREGSYRLRVGDFAPTELGKKALAQGPIDICARVGSSELACRPGRVGETSSMVVLPIFFTGSEGLAGVTIDVRYRGAQVPIGAWTGPLGLSGKGLCNGQLVEPAQPGGDKLGTISLFADDATYVEVGRAATTKELEALRERFQTPLEVKLFETSKGGSEKYALGFGPVGNAEAERIRWAVNDAGGTASVTLGADFVGAPRTLK